MTGSHEPVVNPLVVVMYTLTEVIQGMAIVTFEDNGTAVTVWKKYSCVIRQNVECLDSNHIVLI